MPSNKILVKRLIKGINKLSENIQEDINIMEVCGTHTRCIYEYGIPSLLPSNIKLLSGPGCPICVTPNSYIDSVENLACENIIITSFHEVSNLKEFIKPVYSPFDALNMAKKTEKEVVFLGIGFEPTSTITAIALKRAKELNINNFSLLSYFKTMPQVLEMVSKNNIQGFVCPGHVGAIIGNNVFNKIAIKSEKPMVMCGFEPMDILIGIHKVLKMIYFKKYKCSNVYNRVVKKEGNKKAIELINEVFENDNSVWRGFGEVKKSGFKLSKEYERFSAFKRFSIKSTLQEEKSSCICSEIIQGKKSPKECTNFNLNCNPKNPIGPCMLSSEGACRIWTL